MLHWVQITVLVAIAGLLANGQCYARCLGSVPAHTSSQAHSGCHHSSNSKHGSPSQCNDQHHSETAITEAQVDLVKVPTVSSLPVALLVTNVYELSFGSRWTASGNFPERASPPRKPLFLAISVFRL